MALKVISVSMDDEIIKKADEIVKNDLEIKNRSHLLEVLILREYKKINKGKK